MTVRREALERVGPFDATLGLYGDEQEWQERLLAATDASWSSAPGLAPRNGDAPILYVAAAALDHRRSPADARLRSLARAARARGRASRRYDAWRGEAPALRRELRTLAGCLGHVVRRRCPAGLTMVAHSLGRLEQGVREQAAAIAPQDVGRRTEDFLSGESGTVGGLDAARRELVRPPGGCPRAARRPAPASRSRRTPLTRAPACAGTRRRAPRAACAGRRDPRGAGALAPRGRGAPLPAGRAAGSFRTSTACSPPTPPTSATGCWWSTTTSCCPPTSSTACCSSPSASTSSWSNRRTVRAPTPPGASPAAARASVARQTPFVEIGPVTAFARATFSDAAAVPRRAHGLGPRHALGGARPRAWMALRGPRCRGDPPLRRARRRGLLARGRRRRGARAARRAAPPDGRRSPDHTPHPPTLVKVAVVAEFYPRQSDPVLGVWAHRQALAAQAAGAEVHVLVLHRLVPPRASLHAGPSGASALGGLLRERLATRSATACPSPTSPTSPPRGGAPTRRGARGRRPRWGSPCAACAAASTSS